MAKNRAFNFMDDINFGEGQVLGLNKNENIVEEVREKKENVPVKEEAPKSSIEESKQAKEISFLKDIKKRGTAKRVHKNFLLYEDVSNMLKDAATEYNMSETEMLNTILKKVFNL